MMRAVGVRARVLAVVGCLYAVTTGDAAAQRTSTDDPRITELSERVLELRPGGPPGRIRIAGVGLAPFTEAVLESDGRAVSGVRIGVSHDSATGVTVVTMMAGPGLRDGELRLVLLKAGERLPVEGLHIRVVTPIAFLPRSVAVGTIVLEVNVPSGSEPVHEQIVLTTQPISFRVAQPPADPVFTALDVSTAPITFEVRPAMEPAAPAFTALDVSTPPITFEVEPATEPVLAAFTPVEVTTPEIHFKVNP